MDAPHHEPATAAREEQARGAFSAGDAAQSRAVHDATAPPAGGASEVHGGRAICGIHMSGKIKSIVFGGLDGGVCEGR